MESKINLVENRICSTLFKLAVELAISMSVTAAMADVDDDTMSKLRKKCIGDVKNSFGSVQFDRVYGAQNNKFMEDDI